MTEGVASLLMAASAKAVYGEQVPASSEDTLSGAHACYNVYETGDGQFMALGALEPKFWAGFCHAVDRAEWIPRQFVPGEKAEALIEEARALFKSRTRAEWEAVFATVDVCCEPVLSVEEAAFHPAAFRGGPRPESDPDTRGWEKLRTPVQSSGVVQSCGPPPGLGEHTHEVLSAMGLTDEQIEAIQSS